VDAAGRGTLALRPAPGIAGYWPAGARKV